MDERIGFFQKTVETVKLRPIHFGFVGVGYGRDLKRLTDALAGSLSVAGFGLKRDRGFLFRLVNGGVDTVCRRGRAERAEDDFRAFLHKAVLLYVNIFWRSLFNKR